MPILESARLLIRPFTMDDLEEAYNIFEGHPDVWRYDPGRPNTREERRDLLQYRIAEYKRHGFGCMALTLKNGGKLIGYCGLQLYLWQREPLSSPEIELFYKLGRDYWSHGYATEACVRMLQHAWQDLHLPRIVTWALAKNSESVALMKRIGMQVEPAAGYPDEIIGVIENSLSVEHRSENKVDTNSANEYN
ncbi:MAG: GNAT family N-acetyltransferase [Chloroflexota bacterium]|nr:GNAT family N-acetyltransferase [Chloroflexota bacterium]